MMMSNRRLAAGLLALSGLLPLMAQAVEVNFTGNFIDNPPCDVAGPDGPNQPIKVPFGELGITKIDTVNADGGMTSNKTDYGRQDFTLTLSCGTGLDNAVALYLSYAAQTGMTAPFDTSGQTLQTSEPGLGVRLYHQGVIVPPNSGTKITMSDNGVSTLPLYAVPVKSASVTVSEGAFTASASVEINYP